MSKVDQLRLWLLERVLDDTKRVIAFQRACGVEYLKTKNDSDDKDSSSYTYTIRNYLIHYYFMISAGAGNELFYIVVLPTLFWLVDVPLARRIIVVWFLIYYIGQACKDALRLPRPSESKGVVRLEKHYEEEYGFPSTHAMVSFALPFYALLVWYRLGYEVAWCGSLIACIAWCSSITLSRLYVGVHSVTDLIGGIILGFFVLIIGAACGEPIDAFVIESPLAPFVAVVVSFLAIFSYPSPHRWTNAYGDTSLIIAVASGVCCAQSAYFTRHPSMPMTIEGTTMYAWSMNVGRLAVSILLRVAIGCTFLFLTRSYAKKYAQRYWIPYVLPKYLQYYKIFHSKSITATNDENMKSNSSASIVPSTNSKVNNSNGSMHKSSSGGMIDSSEESGVWSIINNRATSSPSPDSSPRDSPACLDATSPTPLSSSTQNGQSSTKRVRKSISPHQFHLRVDTNQSHTTPLSALLSPNATSPPHKLIHENGVMLVEVEFDDDTSPTIVFNPLEVYLCEIPVKYVTYWCVGFAATSIVPNIFYYLGI